MGLFLLYSKVRAKSFIKVGGGIYENHWEASTNQREKCKVIHLETFFFEAPKFYEKNGFETFGKIRDVPVAHCDYFFFKKLLDWSKLLG